MNSSAIAGNWGSLILHRVNPTGKEIGVGAYGRVFEVDYEGTLCAAKELHALLLQYARGSDLQKITEDFLSECQIWSTLRHPCVVQFLGVYYPAMDQYRLPVMVMEKMQHSLRVLVEKYDNIPLNVKLSILDEVCLGLMYLHSRNPPIVHRDLTPNNILLSYRLEAKISDLGVAKVVRSDNKKTMTKLPGTPDFMPPEAVSKSPVYGPSLDVFSYGGVILNVTTQLWPEPTDPAEFNPDTGRRELVSEVKRRQQYLDKMTRGTADLKPLVMSCLDDNPKNRPSLAQVSMTIKRVKDLCNQKSGHDAMSPMAWWTVVSSEQQSQVTSSLTTALEEMTINNEQLRREVDTLKDENDVMKDENKQLTTLLDRMAGNNENQTQQIDVMSTEIETMRDEIGQLKAENQQVKQQLISKESTTARDLFIAPVNIKWEERASIPVYCTDHLAVWLNGLVYVGGGFETGVTASHRIDVYDPVNNVWAFPAISTPCCYFTMATLNNKLLIAGGRNRNREKSDEIITLDGDRLKKYTTMIRPRSHATAVGHQGMLIITGGEGERGQILSSTELFNSYSQQWYACSDLPRPHYWLRSVIVDNALYLIGGTDKKYYPSPAVFVAPLDTLSRHQLKWFTIKDTPWHCSTAVSINNKHLLIVGGYKIIENIYMHTSEVYKLNKIDHSWEAIGHIPSARSSSAAVSTPDNRMIIMGGRNRGQFTNTVWTGSFEDSQ